MGFIEKTAKFTWRLLPTSVRQRLRIARPVIAARGWLSRWRYRGATHDQIFDDEYFRFVDRTTLASAQAIADSIDEAYHPQSIWDVGCGTGALLECLRNKGISGRGLELASAALAFCRSRKLDVIRFDLLQDDLRETSLADVVVSMEVAAQLPLSGADRYVDLLCSLGPVIVFSAEAPGGGDRVSRNEQPREYWIEKFRERKFRWNAARTEAWQRTWQQQKVADWFCRNVLVFEKS